MASTAVPSLYPYQTVDGATYFYGGIIHAVDVTKVIDRCHQLGYTDADIVVDTIFTTGNTLNAWLGKEKTP